MFKLVSMNLNLNLIFVILLSSIQRKTQSLPQFDILWTSKTIIVGETCEIFLHLV